MINKEDVKEILTSINDGLNSNDLDEITKLSEQGVESLDTFELFLQIEEKYGVIVSDEEIEELDTIKKIVDHINQNRD